MLATFKNLQWVHFGSVGIDKLSKNFIKNHSLTITNSAHTNSSAVTTYCLGELFKSCKGICISRNFPDNNLSRDYFNNFYTSMIDYNQIDLSILGYGSIGKELVDILSPLVKSIKVFTRTERPKKNNVRFYTLDKLSKSIKILLT